MKTIIDLQNIQGIATIQSINDLNVAGRTKRGRNSAHVLVYI